MSPLIVIPTKKEYHKFFKLSIFTIVALRVKKETKRRLCNRSKAMEAAIPRRERQESGLKPYAEDKYFGAG